MKPKNISYRKQTLLGILIGKRGIMVYVISIVLGFAYSLRPFRLKERGMAGIFAYSASGAIAYVMVPWMFFYSEIILFILLLSAVLMDKWINLHFHQIIDYPTDFSMGVKTYAVRAGLEQARRTIKPATMLASLLFIGVLVYILLYTGREKFWSYIIVFLSLATLVAAGLYTRYIKQKSTKVSDLVAELPGFYLGLTYLLFRILPPILFAQSALDEPLIWILFAGSSASFLGESLNYSRYQLD